MSASFHFAPRNLPRLTSVPALSFLPPLPRHTPKSSQTAPASSPPGHSPKPLGVHLAKGPRRCHRPPAPSPLRGSRPPATPPSNGSPHPRARLRRSSSPTHRPPLLRRGPRRGLARPVAPLAPALGRGGGAPLLPAGEAVCPSASSQFSDLFASPSLRPRVARCRGPAPPPGPGLFTHSPSIPSRRDPPLGRLRAAAPPPRRGPAPRLRAAPPAPRPWGHLGSLLRTSVVWRQYPNSGVEGDAARARRFPRRLC